MRIFIAMLSMICMFLVGISAFAEDSTGTAPTSVPTGKKLECYGQVVYWGTKQNTNWWPCSGEGNANFGNGEFACPDGFVVSSIHTWEVTNNKTPYRCYFTCTKIQMKITNC